LRLDRAPGRLTEVTALNLRHRRVPALRRHHHPGPVHHLGVPVRTRPESTGKENHPVTSPGWQSAPPSPTPSSPPPASRPSRADGWARRWLTVVVPLSVRALATATTSAVPFLSAGTSNTAGSETSGEKGPNGGSDSPGQDEEAQPTISRPGE